jgi:hypothetical protein
MCILQKKQSKLHNLRGYGDVVELGMFVMFIIQRISVGYPAI